ncbi:phage terminase small subunit [Escherichia coli]|nr:phage terminase small subunit [Escherichia coli]
MSNVSGIGDAYYWSVFKIAEAFGLHRDTVKKRLLAANTPVAATVRVKWSTKTGHRVRVFSSIDFPIRLVVTHHYIRAVLVRCNIQRYSPLLRELHR